MLSPKEMTWPVVVIQRSSVNSLSFDAPGSENLEQFGMQRPAVQAEDHFLDWRPNLNSRRHDILASSEWGGSNPQGGRIIASCPNATMRV